MEQSKERISALPIHIGVVAIDKRALGLPSTIVGTSLSYIYIYIYIYSRD